MKKMLTVIILLIAMMLQSNSMIALAADSNSGSVLDKIEYTSVAQVKDRLYFLGESIYIYDAATGDIKEEDLKKQVPKTNNDGLLLINGGSELHILDTTNGCLYKLSGATFTQLTQFENEIFDGSASTLEERLFKKPLIIQSGDSEKLYLLVSQKDSRVEFDLYYFDLSTGASGIVNVENVIDVTSYQSGKMVATIEKTDLYRIVEIDTDTNKTGSVLYEEEKPRYRITGTAYDESTDKLMIVTGRGIYQIADHDLIDMCIYLPSMDERDVRLDFNCILNGKFVFVNQNVLFTSDLDGEDSVKSLRFANSGLDDTIRGFMQVNPEVKVSFHSGMVWNNAEIVNSLLTQNSEIDIIKIYAGAGLTAIKDKQFYADLSDSEILKESIGLMYPQIKEVLTDNGSILGYPIDMTVCCWSVDENVLRQNDFDISTATMQYWIGFVETKASDFDVDDTTYAIFPEGFTKRDLLRNVLMQYVIEYEHFGQLSFIDPALREIVERILKLPDDIFLKSNVEAGQIDEYDEGLPPLFTINTSLSPNQHIWFFENYEPKFVAPPVFDVEHTPVVRSELCVYFVNPHSLNKEAATEFLEYCAQQPLPTLRCFVEQNYDQPIPNQEFTEFTQRATDVIEDLTKRLEVADEANRADIETDIENRKIALEYAKKHEWLISKEKIDAYKQMTPGITFAPSSLCFTDSSYSVTTIGLSEIVDMMLVNNSNIGSILAETDRKYKMIQMESGVF